MTAPLRLAILGCSALTTGELTLALDWARRCKRPLELTLVVSRLMAAQVKWAGPVRTFPGRGGILVYSRIRDIVAELNPDALLLADVLLYKGIHYELGVNLDPLVDDWLSRFRVLGLDLFDWDANSRIIDCQGETHFSSARPLQQGIARLLPSPYLAPAPSSPGRGRYAMMEDAQPLAATDRAAIRESLGLGSGPVVMFTSSPWQHLAEKEKLTARVASHFPALMLRLLDLAARPLGGVTLVHLGPADMAIPPDVKGIRYRHFPQLPPEDYRRLLGTADLLLTPNCIATSAIRAASMRVPVAALYMGSPVQHAPAVEGSDAQRALATYLQATCPTYAFRAWPLGLHAVMSRILQNNPFAAMQRHLDVLDPDAAVDGLSHILRDSSDADALRHQQANAFRAMAGVGTPDDALNAALEGA
jgi:hypothetical protein